MPDSELETFSEVDETPVPDPVTVLPPVPEPDPASAPIMASEPPESPKPIEVPLDRKAPPGTCPECGKNGFESDKALSTHIRFKHELPRSRKAAAEKKERLAEAGAAAMRGEKIPDFTDITGEPIPPAGPAPAPALVPDKRFESMANMTFDMSTRLLAKVFGPEWLPTPDADNAEVSHERLTMVAAIKAYYESVDLPDIPPGYMLCFCILAYSAPRMAAHPTKTKLQSAWLWLKTKFQRRKIGVPTIVK
jgi:hypothetical protein